MKTRKGLLFAVMLLGLSLSACNQSSPKITGYSIDENNNVIVIYDNGNQETVGNLTDEDIVNHVTSITISQDGYFVINGIKTSTKVNFNSVTISEDGYYVIDGIKTTIKAGFDSITISSDGYYVVNGVKTSIKVQFESVEISEDGYYVINGIKTDIKATEVYTVKFNTGYSATVPDQKVFEGKKVERPQLDRTGYSLDGWFNNGEEWRFNSDVVSNNMTLVAEWTAKQYTLTFDTDGGSPVANMNVTFDSNYTLPSSTKDLYTFNGWKYGTTKVQNSGKWSIDATGDISLVADWVRTTHKINFNSNGGSAVSSITVESYTSVDSLPTPTWTDHVFLGWTLNGTLVELPLQMEDSDINLVASWKGVSDIFEFRDETDGTITITKFIGNETDVVVPSKITNKTVKTIAEDAFENGSNVKKLSLGSALTNLEFSSLLGLSSLEDLTISGNAGGSLKYFFGNNESNVPLTLKTISFAEGSTSYSKGIFDELPESHLFKVNLPVSVKTTPSDVFFKCANIEEAYVPEGVTTLSDRTFCNCSNLIKVNIPSTVTSLGTNCFANVPKLPYLIVPSSVKSFGYASLAATSSVILFERTEKLSSSSVFSIYEDEMDIYYGFEAIKTNETFEYALCKVGSVKQAIILSLVEGATKPDPMPTELEGYPVVLSKVE